MNQVPLAQRKTFFIPPLFGHYQKIIILKQLIDWDAGMKGSV
jgi:hypothetical protein